jgi:hypothetical protein
VRHLFGDGARRRLEKKMLPAAPLGNTGEGGQRRVGVDGGAAPTGRLRGCEMKTMAAAAHLGLVKAGRARE